MRQRKKYACNGRDFSLMFDSSHITLPIRRRELRSKSKIYFKSLANLKRVHKRLFDAKGSKTIRQRPVGFKNNLQLVEANLRTLIKDPKNASKAADLFLEVQQKYSGYHSTGIEVSKKVYCEKKRN